MARQLIISLLISLTIIGCGKNVFQASTKTNPAETATKHMERGNPQKAIDALLKAIGSTYEDTYLAAGSTNSLEIKASFENAFNASLADIDINKLTTWVSILASAHAQLYGIDPLDLGLALAEDKSTETEEDNSSSKNDITRLFPYLPEASDDNIKNLGIALAILDSIGNSNFKTADNFKKGLFLMANASLLVKKIDIDEDGKISLDEASNLTLTDAQNLFIILASAASTIAAGAGSNLESGAQGASSKITSLITTIDKTEGTDRAEKLKNYLVAKSS